MRTLGLALVLVLAACKPDASTHRGSEQVSGSHQPAPFSPGIGMTYGGKIGLEIAPGIIMSPSGMSLGFGF